MSSVDFKVDSSGQADGVFVATNGQVLTLQIEASPALDLSKVVWSVVATSTGADAAAFTPSNGQPTTVTGTVTLTMPGSGIDSYLVRCQGNDGRRNDGTVVAEWTRERIIAIEAATGIRKVVPGESTQGGAGGWTDPVNELVETFAGGAGNVVKSGTSVANEVPTLSGADLTGGTLARGPLLHVDDGAGDATIRTRTAVKSLTVGDAGGSVVLTGTSIALDGPASVSQSMSLTGTCSATVVGTVTDLVPTGDWPFVTELLLTPLGAVVHSLSPIGVANGQRIKIVNRSTSESITLTDDDGASGTAAWRFKCPSATDIIIPEMGAVWAQYSTTRLRWEVEGAVGGSALYNSGAWGRVHAMASGLAML